MTQRWQHRIAVAAGHLASPADVEAETRRLITAIGGPPVHEPPWFGAVKCDGSAVEIDDRYHYLFRERGAEYDRRSTSDLDMLLYWIARDMTWASALHHELYHRRNGEGARRQMFAIWLDLMRRLDDTWATRLDAKIAAILAAHPFDDTTG